MFAALLLLLAQAAAAEPAETPSPGLKADAARLERCLDAVDADAEAAYEDAMAWAHETRVREAYVCAAIANVARGRIHEGAQQLENLSIAVMGGSQTDRAGLLVQAGNAWLLAREPGRALNAFNKAVRLVAPDPDLLIDRARAHAALGDYRKAEEDLSRAIDLRGDDPLALRLRSAARLKQNAFDLALRDAEAAVALAPTDVDGLIARGAAREAKRTGRAPE